MGNDRKVSVSREISKLHQETVRGTLVEVAEHFEQNEPKGEIVIILSGKTKGEFQLEVKSNGLASDVISFTQK